MASRQKGGRSPRVELAIDLALLIGLTLFVGLIMLLQYRGRLLYHDNWSFYGLFRDQLHSLNRFGEIGWWAPHYQLGYPAYYYAILGNNNCSGPVFVLWGALCWIAGRLGFQTDTFYLPYVINYSFVTPLLSNLAAYALLRQLFHNRTVVRYGLILAAMSPSVVQNATSAGVLESLTYGLYFLAAYLYFLRNRSPFSFWLLGLTGCLLILTFNHASLLENAVLLPDRSGGHHVRAAGRMAAVMGRIDEHPALAPRGVGRLRRNSPCPMRSRFSQGKDIIRTKTGGREYDLDRMCVGNPLIGMIPSTPNVGFNRVPGYDRVEYITLAPSNTPCMTGSGEYSKNALGFGYYYFGLLCMPLVCVALSAAKPRVRKQLVILLALFFGMMCLVMYSPLWSFVMRTVGLMRTKRPLAQRVEHRRRIVRLHRGGRRGVAGAPGGSPRRHAAADATAVLPLRRDFGGAVHRGPWATDLWTARVWFPLIAGFPLSPRARLAAAPRTGRRRGSAAGWLLFLVFLDSGTFLYMYLREVRLLPYVHEVPDKLLPGKVGFESSQEEQANNVMSYRQFYEMLAKGFNPGQVPPGAVTLKAHVCGDVESEKARLELAQSDKRPVSIPLDEAFAKLPEFAPFLSDEAARQDSAALQGDVKMEQQGYNALTIHATSSRPCLLFLRNAYSPYWTAEISSRPIPIARAWFNFQAIPLPQGKCEVHLRFAPPWIVPTLVLAYLVLLGIGGLCFYHGRHRAS